MPVHLAAGLLMYRITKKKIEFFLVHPGGPFFKNKDAGVWSIPKGLPDSDEELLKTAEREFFEETGIRPSPPYHPLGNIKQKGGKIVHAWAFVGEWNEEEGIQCNTFELEWPPKSGKFQQFPEMDRAAWMSYEDAKLYIRPEQIPLLDRALQHIEAA
jgi:predicted NUDIX family NTP pyrophosphohydrolase